MFILFLSTLLQEFRKCLVKMFLSQDEDVLFFESARQLNKFPHMVLNCVPVPKETGDTAPIYFKVRLYNNGFNHFGKLYNLTFPELLTRICRGLVQAHNIIAADFLFIQSLRKLNCQC